MPSSTLLELSQRGKGSSDCEKTFFPLLFDFFWRRLRRLSRYGGGGGRSGHLGGVTALSPPPRGEINWPPPHPLPPPPPEVGQCAAAARVRLK